MSESNVNNNADSMKVNILTQYTKDLSFEIPNSPEIYTHLKNTQNSPEIRLASDVQCEKEGEAENVYEVILTLNVDASLNVGTTNDASPKNMFHLELRYAGLFEFVNVPENTMGANLLVYCPSLLFPYARNLITTLTSNSGFLPIQIQPINFAEIFMKKQQEELKKSGS